MEEVKKNYRELLPLVDKYLEILSFFDFLRFYLISDIHQTLQGYFIKLKKTNLTFDEVDWGLKVHLKTLFEDDHIYKILSMYGIE